jgi:hypothetical protein
VTGVQTCALPIYKDCLPKLENQLEILKRRKHFYFEFGKDPND